MDQVHFLKDIWNCYLGRGKQIGQSLSVASPVSIPEFFAKANSSQSLLAIFYFTRILLHLPAQLTTQMEILAITLLQVTLTYLPNIGL